MPSPVGVGADDDLLSRVPSSIATGSGAAGESIASRSVSGSSLDAVLRIGFRPSVARGRDCSCGRRDQRSDLLRAKGTLANEARTSTSATGESGWVRRISSQVVQEAERLGYDSVWAAEAYGSDAATVLAWLAAGTTKIKLGSAIFQMPGPHARR